MSGFREVSRFSQNDVVVANLSGEEIPVHSIAKVLKVDVSGVVPVVHLTKPDGDDGSFVAIGEIPLADDGYTTPERHSMSFSRPRWVKYSDYEAPEPDDIVGPVEDSWEISSDGTGYRVWGVNQSLGIVLVEQLSSGVGGTWFVSIVELIEECDCKVALVRVIYPPCNDNRYVCGDEFYAIDVCGFVLNNTIEALEGACATVVEVDFDEYCAGSQLSPECEYATGIVEDGCLFVFHKRGCLQGEIA